MEIKRRKKKPKADDGKLKIKRRKKKPKSYETCKGPLVENCERCPKFPECLFRINSDDTPIEWHSKIPFFIIDKYLPLCSGVVWKVFCYLNRRADFRPSSNNFGQCYPSYARIADEAGVSIDSLKKRKKDSIKKRKKGNIGAIARLVELGLIEHTPTRRARKFTLNNFTIVWFKRVKELRRKIAHGL